MPVGHVLVCDPRGDVKHNDTALALDVVAISKTTKLLLSGCVPDIEANGTKVGRELQRVDFHTESSCERQREKLDRGWWIGNGNGR